MFKQDIACGYVVRKMEVEQGTRHKSSSFVVAARSITSSDHFRFSIRESSRGGFVSLHLPMMRWPKWNPIQNSTGAIL
jgi:hypothetical protein